jgi:hypothetical protein
LTFQVTVDATAVGHKVTNAAEAASNEQDPPVYTPDVDPEPDPGPVEPGDVTPPTVTSPISGTVINDPTPTFTGTAEPGAMITATLQPTGTVLCTTTADAEGNWSCTPTTDLPEGDATIHVVAGDDEGNVSDPTIVDITIDTTPPDPPTVTAPISGTTVITSTPTFTGTGEAGGEVKIYDDEGNVVCTTTVDQDGNWTCTPDDPLDEGEQTYEVTVTDEAGNESDPTEVTVTVSDDTTPPDAPTVTEPEDGDVLNDDPPTFEGETEPGATIEVRDDEGNVICETVADENGNWTCTPDEPLGEGEHDLDVVAIDDAGNESDPTDVTITVDTTPPTSPTVTEPVSGTAVITNTPTFEGTGEPGGEVTIYDDNGNVVCTTTVDQDGNWTCTPDDPLDEGEQTYEVTVTDEAGNESDPTEVPLTIDTTPPNPPTVTSPVDNSVTNQEPLTVTGTTEPGATVEVRDDEGNVLCETVADANGNWSCSIPDLEEGDYTFDVVAIDELGNESDPTPVDVKIDYVNPPLAITSPADGDATNDDPPTFEGISEPGIAITVTDGLGNVLCTATADAEGNWSCTPDEPLGEGEHQIGAIAADGTRSSEIAIIIDVDTTPPNAPTVIEPEDGGTIADDPPTFSGETEPGATIQVRDDEGNVICETVADENGNWTCTPDEPLGDGEYDLDVVAIDEAGNESEPTEVAITVKISDNQAPVAVNDAFNVPESVPAQPSSTLDVLANDSDPDNNPFTIITVGKPTKGTAKTDGKTIAYTPEDDFLGEVTFSYIISDGALTDTADITLTVLPVADLAVSQRISATISGYNIFIVARNLGPRDVISPGAVISDTFHPAIGSTINWTCVASGGAVCPNANGTGNLEETLTTFPANSVMTYTVSASGGTNVIVWNTVTITAPDTMFDVIQNNNRDAQPTVYRIVLPVIYKDASFD